LEALNKAGQAVVASLDLKKILGQITHQAWDLTGYRGSYASLTNIALVEGDTARFVAAYPEDELAQIHAALGSETIMLEPESGKRIGITGRVLRSGLPELVPYVLSDHDYIRTHPETRLQLSVPIKYGEKVLGVINVEYPELRTGEDKQSPSLTRQKIDLMSFAVLERDLETLAAYAAIAILNSRQYDQLEDELRYHEAIYKVGQEITRRITAPRKELLEEILRISCEQIKPAEGANLVLGTIQLVDETSGQLRLECIRPPEAILGYQVGDVIDRSRRSGISGRAFFNRQSQLVKDVSQDSDYLTFNKATKSELDVPLIMGEEALGVISLESDQLAAYDEKDQHALETLAELAVITIENARRYQKLKEAQNRVGALAGVTFMGKVESTWRHNARNLANAINTTVVNIQTELKRGGDRAIIEEKLERIRKIANEIMEIQMPPLHSEQGVEQVLLNLLIRDRVDKLQRGRHAEMSIKTVFDLHESARVRASPEWLRRALDILIENGVQAAACVHNPQIIIHTLREKDGASILVSDNGCGIPDDIRSRIFSEPIQKKAGEKGTGLGLFLAQAIILTYNGKLEIRSTGPAGTTMAIWLPLERN
jgi:signal transduction histidine kinase